MVILSFQPLEIVHHWERQNGVLASVGAAPQNLGEHSDWEDGFQSQCLRDALRPSDQAYSSAPKTKNQASVHPCLGEACSLGPGMRPAPNVSVGLATQPWKVPFHSATDHSGIMQSFWTQP